MAKPHMPTKSAVASSFSDDIMFLRMPGTQRQRSERLQASGPLSLVLMTSGPFPPAELFFFLFLEGGKDKGTGGCDWPRALWPLDVTGGLCEPETCRPPSPSLGWAGKHASVSWVLVDLGSETLRLQPPPASDLPRISGQNSAEIDLKLKNRGWS